MRYSGGNIREQILNLSSQNLELGEHIGPHPVSERIRILETIMRRLIAQQQRNSETMRFSPRSGE